MKLWALTCPSGCEDHLRSDPLWSATPLGIPETPDEKADREDVEKRGMVEQAQSTASALDQLAKLGALPEVMGRFMEYLTGQAAAPARIANTADELLLCRNGHRNPRTAGFCSDCGVSMTEPVASGTPVDTVVDIVEDTVPPGGKNAIDIPENLESMSITALRELALKLGAKTARSKDDQITAIRAEQSR